MCGLGSFRTGWVGPAVVALLLTAGDTSQVWAGGPGLSGRVFAIDDKGLVAGVVPAAAIEFKDAAGKVAAQITSDQNGYYQVDLAAGTYSFRVRATGYKTEAGGRSVTLKRSNGYAVHNFSLAKGPDDPTDKPPPPIEVGTLRGRVLEKKADGQLTGIPGARVALRPQAGGRPTTVLARGTGDKDPGAYSTTLPAGAYRASASALGFETVVDPEPIDVSAEEGANRDFILTRVIPPPPRDQGIRGTITVRDARGPVALLPPITVSFRSLTDPSTAIAPTAPDKAGAYARDLPAGRYQVIAQAGGYKPAMSGAHDVFAGRRTIVNLQLVAEPATELVFVGTVFERDGEKPRRPLPGATVLLRKEGEPLSAALRGTSDPRGVVRLTPSGTGRYQALARKDGFEPAGVPVEVLAGETRAELELVRAESPAQPTLTMRVVDGKEPMGRPVLGAQIRITQTGRAVSTGSTDAAGGFHIQMPAGSYRVDVSRTGHVPAGLDIVLADRDVTREVILLPRDLPQPEKTTRLTLDVVERSGTTLRAIPGADVVLIRHGQRVQSGRTGADGRFETRVAAATYRVEASRAGFDPAAVDLVVGSEDVQRQVVLVRRDVPQPPGKRTLTVTVVESPRPLTTVPVGGAEVVISQHGVRVAGGPADRDGHFAAALPAGTYLVSVTKTEYNPGSAPVTLSDRDGNRQIVLARKDISPTEKPELTVQVFERLRTGLRPLPGADIVVSQHGRRIASGRAGADGRHAFRLPPGAYHVDVSRAGFTRSDIDVTMSDRNLLREVVLVRKDTPQPKDKVGLTLRVMGRSKTGSVPLPGAEVVVSQQGRSVLSGQTGADGRYAPRLPAGTYRVDVSQEGYAATSLTVTLTDQDVNREVVLVKREVPPPPPQGGTLTVLVKGSVAKGVPRPLSDARITITGPGGPRTGQTDAAGRYSVQLPAGKYHVKVAHGVDHQPAEADVAVSSSAVTREFTLPLVRID